MQTIDQRIVDFIACHHVLTLAVISGGVPQCSNAFYVYEHGSFIIAGGLNTEHGQAMKSSSEIAAAIYLETHQIGKIEGLQIKGHASLLEGKRLQEAKKSYLKAFPYAAVMELTLWDLRIESLKYTDNRLGFGKKLQWKREDDGREREIVTRD